MGGSAWSPHLLGYGRAVPQLAPMEPRFTGHGPCGGDVKQRSRHAESWTAETAGQSSPWMPGTRTKGTGKQRRWGTRATWINAAGQYGDRDMRIKHHPGCGDMLRCVPEPAAGHVEMHRETLVAGRICLPPNVSSPQHFSSDAC